MEVANNFLTLIQKLDKDINNNSIYIKRDDLIPYSFGGNKARKAIKFFHEIDENNYDCVVTYGSSSSNHCRVVANLAAGRNLDCYVISPKSASNPTFNSKITDKWIKERIVVDVEDVHNTIELLLSKLKDNGRKPYFIPGGGHGNLGTEAYVECFHEIQQYEICNDIKFDYIFHASGTGTTQAGLVCGKLISKDSSQIIGISIARKNPYGRNVIRDSIDEYLSCSGVDVSNDVLDSSLVFIDDYVATGYGSCNKQIDDTISRVMRMYGIPLDSTYTGKAFWGMEKYISSNDIKDKNILFIHTGGAPLYFDHVLSL